MFHVEHLFVQRIKFDKYADAKSLLFCRQKLQKSNICVYVEPSESRVVGLVVGESHGLAERDTCYFTATSAAASAAVGATLATVSAAIAAVAAAATIAVSVAATIAVSIAAIAAALWLIVRLQQLAVAADTMVKSVGSKRSILDNISLF
jgi:hypothetical protein